MQRGASFYSGGYRSELGVPVYRTRDRELAPAFQARGAVSVRWRFARVDEVALSAGLHGELHYYRYFDTPLLPERVAGVTGLTVGGEM